MQFSVHMFIGEIDPSSSVTTDYLFTRLFHNTYYAIFYFLIFFFILYTTKLKFFYYYNYYYMYSKVQI